MDGSKMSVSLTSAIVRDNEESTNEEMVRGRYHKEAKFVLKAPNMFLKLSLWCLLKCSPQCPKKFLPVLNMKET